MEPRELEMDELSILEYLSSDSCRPKSMLEVNSSPFNISEERIAVINAIVLTPKAIANIEGNDNSEPHAVNLIGRNESGDYYLTEKGYLYLELILVR